MASKGVGLPDAAVSFFRREYPVYLPGNRLVATRSPSSLIIDEPELGLHPAAISILAELIQNASKRTQIIVATQSPALIDNFSVEDVIVVSRKDGASMFERLNEKDYRAWLESYSVGELWSKNVISGGPVYE